VFLGNVEIDGVSEGTPVVTKFLAPQLFDSTHLKVLSNAYEKYRFTSLMLRVNSTVSTNASGSYVAGISNDPGKYPIDGGYAAVSFIKDLDESVMANVWVSASASCDCSNPRMPWFLTGATDSFDQQVQAVALVAIDVPIGTVTGKQYFSVLVEGSIDFINPCSNISNAGNAIIVPKGTLTVVGPGGGQPVGELDSRNTAVAGTFWYEYVWGPTYNAHYYQLLPPITFTTPSEGVDADPTTANYLVPQADSSGYNIFFYDSAANAKAYGTTGLVAGVADFLTPTETAIIDAGSRSDAVSLIQSSRPAEERQKAVTNMLREIRMLTCQPAPVVSRVAPIVQDRGAELVTVDKLVEILRHLRVPKE